MKTEEIEVGVEYVYQRWSNSVEKVTVLRTGVKGSLQNSGYYTSRPKVHTNLVEIDNGVSKQLVQPQKIVRTWAEEKRDRRRASRYRTEEKKRRQALREHRARVAWALHETLLAKGVEANPDRYPYVSDDEDVKALLEVGFTKAEGEYRFWHDEFVTPVQGLAELMENGDVDLDHVALLLGVEG